MVQMPNHDPVSFDVVYPLQTLKPISSQLRSRVQNEFAHDDRTWKERLQNAILSIPLTLTAELGKPKTSLGKLMEEYGRRSISYGNSGTHCSEDCW